MKTKFLHIGFWAVCLISLFGCTKKELLNKDTAHVVRLNLEGNSTDTLEYLVDNKVLATASGAFTRTVLVGFDNTQQELIIRKKNSKETLQNKIITTLPFDQNFNIYYDGTQAYDKYVLLLIKGYALSGELEFVVGDHVIYSGTGVINKDNLQVLINENSTREIQVRKKGETTILLTKTLSSSEKQSLNFFFDGTKVVDNVQLTPPSNPANMFISAKFQSIYASLGYYLGVDVDLVFYQRNSATGAAAKMNPEIRFTLPADGTFRDIELPPLPDGFVYSCDLFEKGTNNLPYIPAATVPPLISAALPYQPNVGRFGNPIVFEAGKSKLLLIGDNKFFKTSAPRSTCYGITVNDLSQYFK